MPPRTRYTAQHILNAALELTRESGIDVVTARSVASKLGCSTGPIFTQFASMEALHEQLLEQIMALFIETALHDLTEEPLVGAGVGWLRFAAQEPQLYEAMFLRRHPWSSKWNRVRRDLAVRISDHPAYAHLSLEARFALVGRASVVLHGLGVEIWAQRLPHHNLKQLIREFTVPVIRAALANNTLNDPHTTPLTPHKERSS